MFKQYSYKIKFKALVALFFLLGLTSYKRSFSSLLASFAENRALSKKVNAVTDNTGNIKQLDMEIVSIDKVIGKEGINKEMIQQDIIDFATRKGSGVSIFNMESIHEFSEEDYKVYTNQLDVTGSLNELLLLSYKFERDFAQSRLVSLNYYTIKKNNTEPVLHLKMLFQNYENN